MDDEVGKILSHYPRIYFACHSRHRQDPESGKTLSANQASILDHLDAVEPTSLKNLAEHMGVTPSTMSISIDRLVRGGWVARARDRVDARKVNLLLTSDGARMKQAQSVLDPERVAAMLARLSTDERQKAVDSLSKLAEAATKEIASWSRKEKD